MGRCRARRRRRAPRWHHAVWAQPCRRALSSSAGQYKPLRRVTLRAGESLRLRLGRSRAWGRAPPSSALATGITSLQRKNESRNNITHSLPMPFMLFPCSCHVLAMVLPCSCHVLAMSLPVRLFHHAPHSVAPPFRLQLLVETRLIPLLPRRSYHACTHDAPSQFVTTSGSCATERPSSTARATSCRTPSRGEHEGIPEGTSSGEHRDRRALSMARALHTPARWNLMPPRFASKSTGQSLAAAQGW